MWGAMLDRYHKLKPKPKMIAELKDALQSIWDRWDDVSQEPIEKTVKDFTKRLKACVQANGGHFEHLM